MKIKNKVLLATLSSAFMILGTANAESNIIESNTTKDIPDVVIANGEMLNNAAGGGIKF